LVLAQMGPPNHSPLYLFKDTGDKRLIHTLVDVAPRRHFCHCTTGLRIDLNSMNKGFNLFWVVSYFTMGWPPMPERDHQWGRYRISARKRTEVRDDVASSARL